MARRGTVRHTRTILGVVGVVATLGLLTAACGTGTELAKASGYPSPNEKPQRGGKVVYGLEAETTDLCLAQATLDISGIQKAMAVYDTLTRPAIDPSGKLVYAPFLAESVDHSADYKTWTVKVRKGVKFTDGSELDAQVVKDNLDTFKGLGKNKTIKALLFLFVFKDISEIKVTDKYTVTITTARPWVAFDAYLYSSGRVGMMAESQLENKQCNTTPIGTGPFMLKTVLNDVPKGGCASTAPGKDSRTADEPLPPCALKTHGQPSDWSPYEKVTLVRNPNYWQKAPDGKPFPYLDTIEFRPFTEGTQKRNALQSGEIQMMHTSTSDDFKALEDFRTSGQANYLLAEKFTEVVFVQLNDSKAPFNDLRIRQALQYGVSREDVNTILNRGAQTVADGPFAPGSIAYLKDPGWPKHNVAKAKQLLKDYLDSPEGKKAWPNGKISVTLELTPDPFVIQAGQLLQASGRELGVDIKLDPIEQVQLINRAISGDFDLTVFRNYPGGDPDINFVWWYCNGTPPAGYTPPSGANPVNFSRFCDPEVDKALDTGRSETDPAKRQQIYQGLNRRMAEQGWSQWAWYTSWAVGFNPKVHDVYGPNLPNGDKPWPALVLGHQVTGLWLSK